MSNFSLSALCKNNGLTLADLAERLGRSRDTVKKWGVQRRVPAEAVSGIVEALGGKISRYHLRPDIFPPDFQPPEDAR